MTDTAYSRRPVVTKGVLIQLVEDSIVGFTPNIVFFQYNPATITRTLTPYDPFTEGVRSTIAPGTQPYDPKETIQLQVELDAADAMGDENPFAVAVGVADRVAAIEKMTLPSKGLVGDLVESAAGLATPFGAEVDLPQRPSVPVVLFVWGPARFVPVRITEYQIEEQLFSPLLYTIQARITMSLEVLTPAAFLCEDGVIVKFAKALYSLNRLQQDTLAVAHVANNIYEVAKLAGA